MASAALHKDPRRFRDADLNQCTAALNHLSIIALSRRLPSPAVAVQIGSPPSIPYAVIARTDY
jgi:hypothetical protein